MISRWRAIVFLTRTLRSQSGRIFFEPFIAKARRLPKLPRSSTCSWRVAFVWSWAKVCSMYAAPGGIGRGFSIFQPPSCLWPRPAALESSSMETGGSLRNAAAPTSSKPLAFGSICRLEAALDAAGCCFLFAPLYHPAFKAVAPVRKALAEEGSATIFNLLGPLLNPVRPDFQLAGVFDPKLLAGLCGDFWPARPQARVGRSRNRRP